MAKRKRLSPAQPRYLTGDSDGRSPLAGPGSLATSPSGGAAPIAQVASEASSQAALQELSAVLETARAKGLMIEEVPLQAVDEAHLVRDRIDQNEEEMQSLMKSIRGRGQQTPVELVPLEDGLAGKRYGLVSGWRRLQALTRLHQETGAAEYATVKALIIRPETAQDAYVAMVEENEIRVNLSHYERARIAVRALKEGVFQTQKQALQSLFSNAPRAKRSKIGSFVTLVEALDSVLFFPTAISEKLGLSLVRVLNEDAGFAEQLKQALRAAPRESAAEELEILGAALAQVQMEPAQSQAEALPSAQGEVSLKVPLETKETLAPPPSERPRIRQPGVDATVIKQVRAGVQLRFDPQKQQLLLQGAEVDQALMEQLQDWLSCR